MKQKQSDSTEQQSVEKIILEELNIKEGLNLKPTVLSLDDGHKVQLDGYDDQKNAICEIYAHIGKLKGSQPDKVASDILKMLLVEKELGREFDKYLCFVSEEAKSKFAGKSWLALSAKKYDIKVKVVKLPIQEENKILDAQKRQDITKK